MDGLVFVGAAPKAKSDNFDGSIAFEPICANPEEPPGQAELVPLGQTSTEFEISVHLRYRLSSGTPRCETGP